MRRDGASVEKAAGVGVPRRGVLMAAGLAGPLAFTGPVRADVPDPLAGAKALLAERLKIASPDGIDVMEHPRIGGIEQWVSIRGRNRANPVILFLHGGPGFPMSPLAWSFQPTWEDHFTVVQWDQRGAGKTFALPGAGSIPLTLAQMRQDAEDMAAWVRERLGQSKIVVIGHSWGTVLGVHLALKRPEWLHAYVGVGQLLDTLENERLGLAALKARAAAAGNTAALAALDGIAPYPEPTGELPLAKVAIDRRWVERLDGMTYGKVGSGMRTIGRLSPFHSMADVTAVNEGQDYSARALLPEMARLTLSQHRHFDCPVHVWMGQHDLATSPAIAGRWLESVVAPSKSFALLPDAAHMVFTEVPGLVHERLLTEILPLAREAQNRRRF